MKQYGVMLSVLLVAGLVQADMHGDHSGEMEAKGATNYSLDNAHTVVGFSVRHLGLAKVKGQFNSFTGSVSVDDMQLETLSINATLDAASIDTNNDARDDHLRNADYFDVTVHPAITFVSTGVVPFEDGHALQGDLTIKGVTQSVTLPVTLTGPVEDPWGNTKIGIELLGAIDRQSFGVGHDGATDELIGDTVSFDIAIQAVQEVAE